MKIAISLLVLTLAGAGLLALWRRAVGVQSQLAHQRPRRVEPPSLDTCPELILAEVEHSLRTPRAPLEVCAHCGRIRDDQGHWGTPTASATSHPHRRISHGVCPVCMAAHYPAQTAEPLPAEEPEPRQDHVG